MTRMPPWFPMQEPPLPSEEPVVTEDEGVDWDTSRTAALSRLFPASAGSAHEGRNAVYIFHDTEGVIQRVDRDVLSESSILGFDVADHRTFTDPAVAPWPDDPDTEDCE